MVEKYPFETIDKQTIILDLLDEYKFVNEELVEKLKKGKRIYLRKK